jgi:hypothetical protein
MSVVLGLKIPDSTVVSWLHGIMVSLLLVVLTAGLEA